MSASEGTQAPVSKKKQQKGQVLHLEEFKSILNANESQPSRSWGDEDPVEEDRNYSRDRFNGDGGRAYRDSPKGGYNREFRDDGKSSDDSKWERSSETKDNSDSDRERGGYRSNDYGGRGGDRNDYAGRGGDRNNYRDRNERSDYNRSDRGDYGGRGGDRSDYGGRGDRGDSGSRGGDRSDYGGRGDRGEYGGRGDRGEYGGRGDRDYGSRGDRDDYGGRGGDRNRERNYDNKPKELPTQPPWDAYVGNLRYELEEGAIGDFFSKDCKVKRVRLQRNKDTNQPLGYAYVEFEDLESLKTALNLNGENFQSRNIRVDVATRAEKSRSDNSDKWTRKTDFADSHPAERSDRGGYNRGGSRDYNNDRNRDFRGRDNDRNRDYDRNRDSDRDQEKGEERQRPKLNLLPRSVDNPVGSAPSTKGTPKSDPFGGARPRDESAFVKKKPDTPKDTVVEPPPEPEKKETQKYTPPHASNRNSKADRQDWRNDNKDQKDSKGGSSGKAWGKPKEDEREHSEESRPQSKGREKTEEAPKRAAKREEKPKVSNKSNHNPFSALSSDD